MSNYTVNPLNQAAWLVYINGLEIPVAKVDVQYGVWAIPTLTLQMVPHTILTRIGAQDRLQVVVFYLDTHWDPSDPQFCLMGEFEVVGWGYTSSPRGRSIQLNCVSQLQIFEQLHFFYVSSLADMVTASVPSYAGDAQQSIQVKPLYPASLFLEGLTSPSTVAGDGPGTGGSTVNVDNYIKRPIDFVTNIFRSLMREVGGSVEGPEISDEMFDGLSIADRQAKRAALELVGSIGAKKGTPGLPGKNFFARWLLLTKFHHRWMALPWLEDAGSDGCFPLIKAVQDTSVLPVLQQQIGDSVGAAGSAWDLLKQVLGYMYMEIGVLPAPPAAQTTKGTGRITPSAGVFKNTSGRATVMSIPTFFVKPQCMFALPPACNVIFPSMVSNYTFQENYIRQPTRIYLGESFMSNLINQGQEGNMTTITQELMSTGFPASVRKRMRDLVQDSPESNNKNFLLFPEEFFKGPVTKRMNAPPWMYMLYQQQNSTDPPSSKEDAYEKGKAMGEGIVALSSLFDLYAEYEFYRSRYAERNGGVNLAFNPYVVPGFPAAIFDKRDVGMDTMGYVASITHSMSAGPGPSMTTQIGLSFLRTIPEFVGMLGDVRVGATESNATTLGLDIAPVEIIPDVRDAFQKIENAQVLYKRLLYRDAPMSKSAAFNWKEMMNVANQYGDIINVNTDAWELDPYVALTPKSEAEPLFESRDAAMRYAARPACTLKEYIETWHGIPIEKLIEDGVVQGEYTSFYSPTTDTKSTKGTVFWGRIYKLVQGPGLEPDISATNMGPSPDYSAAGDGGLTFVDPSTGMPDTRDNWDVRLEEYRKIVRSELGRIAPQR